jgi:hypothetical protein
LALVVSGCALSLSEFADNSESQDSRGPVVLTGQPDFDTGNTSAPPPTAEALAEQAQTVAGSPTALAPAPGSAGAAQQAAGANAAPASSNSDLLTPEEKARVIAELEALARGQTAPAPAAQATSNECDPDATQTLESGCSTEQ